LYLKSLEIVGFKSFADKTRLEFEPGMTAIVGPNGCGKSNVSDSLRWVLGEQSAKALRGAKMEDVIFNGTDTHKPLGMAEVSLCLADCEAVLGTDYNEVTITRRVFRTGEGQYFINKAPCRLKDIQRLFMDTGIGTNAYSLMEQGRIDRFSAPIRKTAAPYSRKPAASPSSRPTSGRPCASWSRPRPTCSGWTTSSSEVKRQIISLQRQAGKAKRYQELHSRLRAFDLYATRERLQSLESEIGALEQRLAGWVQQDQAAHQAIEQAEALATGLRAEIEQAEQRMRAAMEASVTARTELDRVRELARHNVERIQEMKTLAERDTRDAEEARARREQHEAHVREQETKLARAVQDRTTAERELADHVARLAEAEKAVDEAGKLLHRLRAEQVDLDMRLANLQNELNALDAKERTNTLRRERLAAEHGETQRAVEMYEQRQVDMGSRLVTLREDAEKTRARLDLLQNQRLDKTSSVSGLKQSLSDLRAQAAARKARIELLEASREQREGFSEGARALLSTGGKLKIDRTLILGPLAEQIRIEPACQIALEAALRPWLDAIVVQGQAGALAILAEMERQTAGAVRLLSVEATPPSPAVSGQRLLDLVKTSDPVRQALERVIGNIVLVDQASDIPNPLPAGSAYVTKRGVLIGADGKAELWKHDEAQGNPLARQQALADWKAQLDDLQQQMAAHEASLKQLQQEELSVEQAISEARRELEERRRALNVAEGENQVFGQEAKQARERADTVAWELKSIEEQHHTGDDRRTRITNEMDELRKRQDEIRSTLSTRTEALRELEQNRSRCVNETGDRRVRFSEARQAATSIETTMAQLTARVTELSTLIEERSRGVVTYQTRITDLEKAVAEAEARVAPLEAEAAEQARQLDALKQQREKVSVQLHESEAALRVQRGQLEDLRKQRSQAKWSWPSSACAARTCWTGSPANTVSRWTRSRRPRSRSGTTGCGRTARCWRPLSPSCGPRWRPWAPVNLVAIEEHRELEERFQFLTQQQTDLVNAKDAVDGPDPQINKTTTEMFAQTFEQVNTNFQEMFTKLFGGGTAKLVLIDEGDVLESGIEIIARPPGKKLQTVSLLSGGERTMTAVALLFSLYQVKPSPFCVLDELDAALDDANIGRFVKTVQGFLENSQFVVITHNRQTISRPRGLYGVTMEQQGVSKIVSVKFSEHETRETRYPPQPTENRIPVK
jgi:chromosome segregation protein